MDLVVLESTHGHATIRTDGICTTLVSAMGDGLGYVPIVVTKDEANDSV